MRLPLWRQGWPELDPDMTMGSGHEDEGPQLIFPLVMFGVWSGDDIRHNALVTIKSWQQRGQLVLDRALAVGLRSK